MSRKNILQASFIFITFLLLSSTIIAQNSINKSPSFQLLDKQVEKNYVPQQMNMGIDELTITVPMLYVQLLGSAMRNLKSNLNQYPTSLDQFENLNNEIISIIPQIANVYNSTNSSKIGYEYNDATTLEDYYYRALKGVYSENFKQHYKDLKGKDITQINIPFILDQTGPTYIKEAKSDEGIVLLGVKADEVKGPPPPKYNNRSFPEDFIVGTWTNYRGESITFKKKGNVYVGVIKSQEELNDGWESDGLTRKVKIRIKTMTYEVRHSHLEATSPDPKNPNWYDFFWRWYKGKLNTSYVPQGIEYEVDPIQETTFHISWMDKDKKFSLSIDGNYYDRK